MHGISREMRGCRGRCTSWVSSADLLNRLINCGIKLLIGHALFGKVFVHNGHRGFNDSKCLAVRNLIGLYTYP